MKRAVAKVVESKDAAANEFRTLGEAVYSRLRQDIVWGHLPAGAPLRSDNLREAYDIGISPLREALSRLVAERLVTTVGQRGFRVAPLTTADVADTMETRVLIEGEALVRSIRRGGIDWETARRRQFSCAFARAGPEPCRRVRRGVVQAPSPVSPGASGRLRLALAARTRGPAVRPGGAAPRGSRPNCTAAETRSRYRSRAQEDLRCRPRAQPKGRAPRSR